MTLTSVAATDRACVASIVRVTSFDQVDLDDITWTFVDVATWTAIEQSVGIICACLPTMGPLFGRLHSNLKYRSSEDPGAGKHCDSLPPSDFSSRKRDSDTLLATRNPESRCLDEETLSDVNVVTANVTKGPSHQVLNVHRGLMQHSLEQRSEKADRF